MRRALQLVLLLLPLSAFAQLYPNTDDTLSGWQSPPCLGTACAGGTGTATAYFQTIDNSTPSLDGESMEIGFTGPGLTSGETTNVLWPHKVGANGAVTALSGTWHVYFPNAGLIQAKELDIFQFVGGQRFMYGTECDNPALTAGFLRIWNQCANSNGGAWITTSVACPLFSSSNTWHSFTLNTHRVIGDTSCTGGNPCEYYDSIVIDGTVHTGFTPQCSAPNSEPDNIGIQTQIDESSVGGAVTEFEDEMSLSLAAGGTCAQFVGGTCPVSIPANVNSFYFFDYAAGSDSNSGTSESSPWQHMPSCANATGNSAAHTPGIGEGWIFKGGVTVDYHCYPANPPWGGTSGGSNYMGPDPGWFTGGSWTRPIFNGGGSGGYNTATRGAITDVANHASYLVVDNLEFTNFYFGINCSQGGPEYCSVLSQYAYSGTDVNWELKNSYVHGWLHCAPSASGCVDPANNTSFFWAFQESPATGVSSIHDNVFDGTDSSADCCGVASAPILYDNVVKYVDNWIFGERRLMHDNVATNFVYTFQTSPQDGQSPPHGNCNHIYGSSTSALQMLHYNNYTSCFQGGGDWVANRTYTALNQVFTPVLNNTVGNSFRATTLGTAGASEPNWNSACSTLFSTCTDGTATVTNLGDGVASADEMLLVEENAALLYVFNDVFVLDGHGTGFELANNGSGGGNFTFFNNTMEAGDDPAPNGHCFTWKNGTPTVVGNGNFCVTAGTPISASGATWHATFTPANGGNVITAPIGTGNGTGNLNLTQTYPFAPLDTTAAATVGTTSANNSSFCTTIAAISSAAATACLSDTTLGVAYNATNHTVSYPNRTTNLRPTGEQAWTNGAYERSGTAPQNLTVTVAGGGTVISSPAGISCPGTCSTNFTDGTNVTLTATPSLGYEFSQWVGSCTGTTGCGLIMTSAQSTSASFVNTYLRVTTNTSLATGLCAPSGLPGSGTGLCLPFSTTQNNATVNSTAFDASLNPLTNCQTLIFDQNSRAGASVGNVTSSGGTEDIFGSLTGQYIFLTVAGGVDSILNINTSGACAQVNNTGALSTAGSGVYPNTNGNIVGSAGWSHVTESSFAWLDEHNCVTHCTGVPNPSTSAYSVLYFGSVTGTPPLANPISYTGSYGFDFRQCPGVGTVTAGVSSTALSIMGQDQYYGMGISFTGGQGTGFLYFIWSPTLGCETLDTSTGNVYTWCNSFPCPTTVGSGNAYYIGQETTCYGASGSNGIHDAFERSTNFAKIAQAGSGWTNCGGSGQTSVVWNYQQTTVCNSGCPGPTTVQACTVSCGGHDSSGQLYLLKFNDPSPNRRLFSNLAVETQVASILIGVHGVIMPDPSGFDVGAWALMAQGASTAGNTGFGFNNPPATLYENEMFGIVNWQPASYTGSNPQVSRFGHNYDAENFEAPATALNVTSTTSATITAINVFPPCEANGSCGQLQISTTGFSPNVTGLITSISPAGIVVSGTGYTVGTQSCGGTCTILGNTPNFGCQNAIGFVDQSQTWYVAGYDAFGQMGADSSNQVFCAAIMGRLNAVETFPTGLTISVGNQASQGVQIKP